MRRSRFAEEQIGFALRQAETGTAVEEVSRKLKQPVADLSLDTAMLQEVLAKKL